MSTPNCTEAAFLRDVKDHAMTIIRDDGVNRHIRFSRPGTVCYHFDLITWPGYICYTGDMGTYVFKRMTDMFEFFRQDRAYNESVGRAFSINLGYWTEKLVAIDGNRCGGKVKEFDAEIFTRAINEYRVQWMRDAKESGSLNKKGRRALWEAVDDEVLSNLDDGGDMAQHAAHNFNYDPVFNSKRKYGWSFHDLFESDFTEYTHSIVWCCYALAWGIEQYDMARSKVSAELDAGVAA